MNPNTTSLFRIPRKGHSYINLVPRAIHVPTLMSAGLLYCYKNIKDKQPLSYAEDLCTNDEGCFCPVEGMKPMAWRFQFVEVIGRGQSAVLIKALDMFQANKPVAIKVLHKDYSILGCQEADCLRNLNGQDPEMYSPVLRIYSTFKFGCHFCLVFEILHAESLLSHFEKISEDSERLASVCQVAAQLVKAVGFLQSQNTIHADLKPENLLMKRAGDLNSMKVIDFGNAIRCIHDEMSLYYEDFELQTLLYRAPEVIYGMMFGSEVDMWSIGCILIELYAGHPLFFGVNKASVLFKMTELLGPLPRDIFQRGKFYGSLDQFTERNVLPKSISELMAKIGCRNYAFIDFVSKLLVYDPAKRMTAVEAAIHPFLASELGLKYFPLRPPNTNGVSLGYSTVLLSPDVYPHRPEKKTCTIEIAPFPLNRSHDTSLKKTLFDCRLNKIIKSEMSAAEVEISIGKCSSFEQIPGGIDRNKNCMVAEDENYLLTNSSLQSSARIQKTVLNNHSLHEIGLLLKNRSSELSVTSDTTEDSTKVSPQRTKSLTKVNSQRAKCSEKMTPHRTKSPPTVTSESTRSATKERNIKNSRSVEQKIQAEQTPDKNENFIMPEIINPPDVDWMLKFRPSNYKHKFSEIDIEKAKKQSCVLKRNKVGHESISEIQCTSGQGYNHLLGFKENSTTMKAQSNKSSCFQTNQNNDSGFCSTVEEAKLLKDSAEHDFIYKDLGVQKQSRSAARRSFSESLSNNGSDSILNTTFSIPKDDKNAKSLPRRSGSTLVIESKFNVCSAEIGTPQKISSDNEEFGNESACNQTFTVNLDETFVKDRLKVNKRASKRKYSRRSVNRSGQKNVSCTDNEAFRELNSSKMTDSSCHKKLFSDSNEANFANSAYSEIFSNKTLAKSSNCLNETIVLTSPTNSQKRNCSKKRKRSIVGQRKLKIKLESGTRYQNDSTLDSCESGDSNMSGYGSVLHHKYVGEGVDQESFDDVVQLSPESLSN